MIADKTKPFKYFSLKLVQTRTLPLEINSALAKTDCKNRINITYSPEKQKVEFK